MVEVGAKVGAVERALEPARAGLGLLLLPVAALLLLGVPLIIRVFIVEAFEAEGPSMEPTLFSGERFAVGKSAYGIFLPFKQEQSMSWAMPRLGEVVIIKSPIERLDIIKRVVGVPGDHIDCRGDRVFRNGTELVREEQGCPAQMTPPRPGRRCYREQLAGRRYLVAYDYMPFQALPITVPKGRVYVLGDNRTSSNDSRNPAIGAVDSRRIKGRVTRIYWSPNHRRILELLQ